MKPGVTIGMLIAVASSTCMASVTTIGEFQGQWQESFETFQTNYPYSTDGWYSYMSVLGNHGYIGDTRSYPMLHIYEPGTLNQALDWMGGNYIMAQTHSGAKALVERSPSIGFAITFRPGSNVVRFGGYFNEVGGYDRGMTVRIRDDRGYQYPWIELPSLYYNVGDGAHGAGMYWFGWQSDRPLLSVEFLARGDMVMDDLQASGPSSVPEPGIFAMMLTGLGLMGLVTRRRKQDDVIV